MQWHTTVDRTPLDEGWARRRDLYLKTHNTWDRHTCPRLIFFVLCTLSVLLCPDCPGCAFCPLLYNRHNTNIHAPGGIQTRNPSKRSPADTRFRPLGHWEWQVVNSACLSRHKRVLINKLFVHIFINTFSNTYRFYAATNHEKVLNEVQDVKPQI